MIIFVQLQIGIYLGASRLSGGSYLPLEIRRSDEIVRSHAVHPSSLHTHLASGASFDVQVVAPRLEENLSLANAV
jgi:hypothetical protein